jgi:DNA polymerase I-like protein with 3'-5' exonuclease and polymerase domains
LVGYKGSIYDFAKHLLSLYHAEYPEVKKGWEATTLEVQRTGKVVTPDGWVRIVEGDITKFHGILTSLVAHKPQHWSVWGINQAFWKLFYYLQVGSNGEYRLKGQIHDSIISQAKEDKIESYSKRMGEIMDIPQHYKGGVMNIPLDTDIGEYWK